MTICPWVGLTCDCTKFPWKQNELIPAKCEKGMPLELIPLRAVSTAAKDVYRRYEDLRRKLDNARKHNRADISMIEDKIEQLANSWLGQRGG